MPIKIHHGPPGSYKTAGAVADDLIPAAKAGRLVVTNIRGLSQERVMEALDDVPATFYVLYVDGSTKEGKDKLARWFHWAPHGALVMIDEAQMIFPKRWTAAEIRELDYPGGANSAKAANRPATWDDAWCMHRHYNWDIVLTTPDIKKIRDDIRGAAERAWKHKNLGGVSFLLKGSYLEAVHAAEDNGTSERDFIGVNRRKIPDVTWKLYDSTATGNYTDTPFRYDILKNPRILFLLAVLVAGVVYVVSAGPPAILTGADPFANLKGAPASPVAAKSSGSPVPGPVSGASAGPVGGGPVSGLAPIEAVPSGPFRGLMVHITGFMSVGNDPSRWRYMFAVLGEAGVKFWSDSREMKEAGYVVSPISACAVSLEHKGQTFVARCGSVPEDKGPGRSGSEAASAAKAPPPASPVPVAVPTSPPVGKA